MAIVDEDDEDSTLGRRNRRPWRFVPAVVGVGLGAVLGFVLLGVFVEPAARLGAMPGSLTTPDPCAANPPAHDAEGRLIPSTRESTTIRVRAPSVLRVGVESQFEWHMTGVSLLRVYGENQDEPRVVGVLPTHEASAIEPLGDDDWMVRMQFPSAGCWRLVSQRAGGQLSGELWVRVLPAQ